MEEVGVQVLCIDELFPYHYCRMIAASGENGSIPVGDGRQRGNQECLSSAKHEIVSDMSIQTDICTHERSICHSITSPLRQAFQQGGTILPRYTRGKTPIPFQVASLPNHLSNNTKLTKHAGLIE